MTEEERTLRAARERRAVEEWALVLAAAGIVHRVARGAGKWRLLVAPRDAERSLPALDAYDAERRSAPAGEEAPEYGPTYAGILVAVLLVAFYGVTGPADPGGAWARAGSASPELLAMLGSDREADIAAHLFGLLVGGALGALAALLVARPPGRPAQWALACGALATVAGSW